MAHLVRSNAVGGCVFPQRSATHKFRFFGAHDRCAGANYLSFFALARRALSQLATTAAPPMLVQIMRSATRTGAHKTFRLTGTSMGRSRLPPGGAVPILPVNSVAQFGKKSLQRNLIFKRCLFHGVKIPDCATRACHAVLHEHPHRLRPFPHDLIYGVVRLWDPVAHRSLIRTLWQIHRKH